MILWYNGVIHTMKNPLDTHHQMATDQGLVVGFDEDIIAFDFDKKIDLKGAHVYPGFVDAHMHIAGYGQKLSRLDVFDIKDKQTLIRIIKNGFNQGYRIFEGYHELGIDKKDLDGISFDEPIILKHHDYHSLTVNQVVLDHVGLESDTGFVTEEHRFIVNQSYETYTFEGLVSLIEKAINKLTSLGITGAHSDDLYYFNGFRETIKAFHHATRNNPFRTHLLMHYKVLDGYQIYNHPDLQNAFIELGAVKVFYDGTLSSKTALLNHKYRDTDSYGLRVFDPKAFVHLIQKIRALNLNVAIHVIGDLALEEVLYVLKTYPPRHGLKDRIIHASLISKKALELMKGMPISIDVQPMFIESDYPLLYDLFEKEPDYIYPFKTMIEQGLIISGSSDAPVEDPDPLKGIYQMCYRTSQNITHQKEERISMFEAIKSYTIDANVQSRKKNQGLIEQGYLADFTILNKDLLKIDQQSFHNVKVVMTVIDEEIVHHA